MPALELWIAVGGGVVGGSALTAWVHSRRTASRAARTHAHAHAAVEKAPLRPVESSADRIQLSIDDQLFAELAQGGTSGPLQEVALDSQLAVTAGAWLRDTPAVLNTMHQLGSKLYTLTFSPDVTRGLADGSFAMMQSRLGGMRASAVDSQGKIVGNGTLDAAGRAGTAALAVWQILAVVTAQKFLADIDRKLAQLGQGIDGLKQWLEDARVGQLQGSLSYVRHIAEAIAEHKLSPQDVDAFAAQIEGVERECRQLMATVVLSEARQCEKMTTGAPEPGGLDDRVDALKQSAQEFERGCRTALVAAHLRCTATQVRAALPLSRGVANARLAELSADVATQRLLHDDFLAAFDKRISDTKGGFWDRTSKEAGHRQRLSELRTELFGMVSASSDALAGSIEAARARLDEMERESTRPLQLVVETNERGELTKLSRVLPA